MKICYGCGRGISNDYYYGEIGNCPKNYLCRLVRQSAYARLLFVRYMWNRGVKKGNGEGSTKTTIL